MPEIHLHGFGDKNHAMYDEVSHRVISISPALAAETVVVQHTTVVRDCLHGRWQPCIMVCGTKDDRTNIKRIVKALQCMSHTFDIVVGPDLKEFIPFSPLGFH